MRYIIKGIAEAKGKPRHTQTDTHIFVQLLLLEKNIEMMMTTNLIWTIASFLSIVSTISSNSLPGQSYLFSWSASAKQVWILRDINKYKCWIWFEVSTEVMNSNWLFILLFQNFIRRYPSYYNFLMILKFYFISRGWFNPKQLTFHGFYLKLMRRYMIDIIYFHINHW